MNKADHWAELETPAKADIRLVCPDCGHVGVVTLEVGSELRIRETDEGEVRELHPVVKKKAVKHHCGQMNMAESIDSVMDTVLDKAVEAVNDGALGPNVTATRG